MEEELKEAKTMRLLFVLVAAGLAAMGAWKYFTGGGFPDLGGYVCLGLLAFLLGESRYRDKKKSLEDAYSGDAEREDDGI